MYNVWMTLPTLNHPASFAASFLALTLQVLFACSQKPQKISRWFCLWNQIKYENYNTCRPKDFFHKWLLLWMTCSCVLHICWVMLCEAVQDGFGNVQGYGQMKKMINGVRKGQRNASHTQLRLHLSAVELKLVTK